MVNRYHDELGDVYYIITSKLFGEAITTDREEAVKQCIDWLSNMLPSDGKRTVKEYRQGKRAKTVFSGWVNRKRKCSYETVTEGQR